MEAEPIPEDIVKGIEKMWSTPVEQRTGRAPQMFMDGAIAMYRKYRSIFELSKKVAQENIRLKKELKEMRELALHAAKNM